MSQMDIVYFSDGSGQWEEDTASGGEVSGGQGGGSTGGGGGGGGTGSNTITITNPGPQTGVHATAANLQIVATDSDAGQTLSFTAAALPPGLSISSSGLITGNYGSGGSYTVTVTVTDTTGASNSVTFSWTVTGANTVTLTNPGPQTAQVGTAFTLQLSASDSASGQTLTFTSATMPPGMAISSAGKITGDPTAAGNYASAVTATDTTGAFDTVTFSWTITPVNSGGGGGSGSGLLTYIGYTPGIGSTEIGPGGVDAPGWQTCYQRTGPGAPTGNGRPYALCSKIFFASKSLPSAWGDNEQLFASNNGGVPLVPIIVFDNVPPSSTFKSFLQSLPSGQKCAFQYQSEMEGASGIPASQFVSGWRTISQNLNTALQQMGGGSFWNRTNFPMVTSSIADYYGTNPGSTAYFQDSNGSLLAHIDSFGLDMYHRNVPGSGQSLPVNQDGRFNGWVQAVHKIAGPNVSLSFPEYGISFANNTYSASNEQARADLMKADWNYMTGSSRPSGTKGMMFWNYWYQMDKSYHFCFPLADGSETVIQAGPTIAQWQSMVAKAG